MIHHPHCVQVEPVHPPSPIVSPVMPLRRSTRLTKQPFWLSEYVSKPSTNNVLYPIAASISYTNLSPTYQQYLHVFSAVTEPTTYKEAILDVR